MGMDNNNTIKTNIVLIDDKSIVIDIEMSKLIHEYIIGEQYIGLTRYEHIILRLEVITISTYIALYFDPIKCVS